MAEFAERDVLARLIGTAGRRTLPPEEDYQRTLVACRATWQRAVRQRARRRWGYALAAAALIGVFGAGILRMSGQGPVVMGTLSRAEGGVFAASPASGEWHWLTTPGVQMLSGTRLRTDASGGAAVNLGADNSLRLGASTDLLLNAGRRVELLAGRIYFDARGRGGEGIEIVTRFGTLRDTGTQFEVLATDSELRVRTREGAVTLTPSDHGAVLTCAFSEELRVDTYGRVQRGRIAPHDPQWSWAEALAQPPRGTQLPLRQFLEWVVRESGRRLRYDSPDTEARVGRVMLHGTTPNLAPVKALEVTLATTDIDFVLLDDGTILLRTRQTR